MVPQRLGAANSARHRSTVGFPNAMPDSEALGSLLRQEAEGVDHWSELL